MGAYRLLNNPSVEPEAIAAPHWALTRERCTRARLVLCLQDTMETDDTRHASKRGLGPTRCS